MVLPNLSTHGPISSAARIAENERITTKAARMMCKNFMVMIYKKKNYTYIGACLIKIPTERVCKKRYAIPPFKKKWNRLR